MAKSRSKSKSTTRPATPEAAPAQAATPPAAPVTPPARSGGRRIVWLHVVTVLSVTILIGAEVFGAAFAASWAIATLFDLGGIGARALDIFFMLCGVAIMVQFVRSAHKIEPFTARA